MTRAVAWMWLAAALGSACSDAGEGPPAEKPGDGGSVAPAPAPPDFPVNGKSAIFMEIASAEVTLTIDVAAKKAMVKAHMDIEILQPQGGSPVLDVVPAAARLVTVDDEQKLPLAEVTSPDGASTMRMIDGTLSQGNHALDFDEYPLVQGKAENDTNIEGIEFRRGSFDFLTDQDDTRRRFFTERYFPSGFERNRYPFTVTVVVKNPARGQEPDVMSNGRKEVGADGRSFTISYPAGFSTSAWFLQVLDRNRYRFAAGEYQSVDGRTIPLTAYAAVQADADLAIADTAFFLEELEADYGPYPHDSFLVAIGGVNDPEEYVGAAQSDLDASEPTPESRGALGHEVLHQWFGRSARPLSGRDGWVDEGIAQWRDDGYPRSRRIRLDGQYAPLAVASPYQRHTPDESYDQGAEVLANLDLLLKDRGGIKPVLKAFHDQFRDKLYTTEEYLDFIRQSAADLPDRREEMDRIFRAKVYAGDEPPAPRR